MPKSATERLQEEKQPKMVVMDKDFAGIKAGQKMLVGTPQMIDAYIKKIPYGETKSIPAFRDDLARKNKCEATCPVSTSIFIRIAAEAALEALEAGSNISEITPFWRVVGPEDKIATKLNVDSEWIAHQRDSEAAH